MDPKNFKPGMSWEDFLQMPIQMQTAYIVKMYEHDASLADIARMFRIGTHPMGAHLKKIGLDVSNNPRCTGTAEERRARWDAYCMQTAGRSWPYRPRKKKEVATEPIPPCPNDDDYQPAEQESLFNFADNNDPRFTIATSVEKHRPDTTFKSGNMRFEGYADTIARIIEQTLPGGVLHVHLYFEVVKDDE